MKKMIILLVLIMSLLGCKTPQQGMLDREQTMVEKGYRELKGDELKSMISGNTEQSSTGSYFYHSPDGTFKGVSGQSGKSNSGTWWMGDDGRVCRDWGNNKWVPKGCSAIFINDKTGDIQWYDTDGRWYRTTFHKGNIKGY